MQTRKCWKSAWNELEKSEKILLPPLEVSSLQIHLKEQQKSVLFS